MRRLCLVFWSLRRRGLGLSWTAAAGEGKGSEVGDDGETGTEGETAAEATGRPVVVHFMAAVVSPLPRGGRR